MKRSRSESPDRSRIRRRTFLNFDRFQRNRFRRAFGPILADLPGRAQEFASRIEDRRRREQAAAVRLPAYNITTTRADGHLHTVTFNVLTAGGNNHNREAAQRNLVTMIRSFTRNVIVNSEPGWTNANANNWIRGELQVTSRTNPQSVQRYRLERLGDLNQAMINMAYERFNQSETEIDFDDLDWTIVIAPQSFERGAGLDIQQVKKTKQGQISWQNHCDEFGKLNCAAVALTIVAFPNRNYNTRKHLLYKRARALQTELGWGDIVSIAELGAFVEKYPKYRLTCLTAVERDFNRNTFTGKEFGGEIDPTTNVNKNPFIVYIYFDHQQRHFAAETCPASIYNHLYSKGRRSFKFCHKCIQVFDHNAAHVCADSFVRNEKQIRKKVKCDRCEKDFQPSQNHNCQEFKCRNCHAQVPKGHEHRCAIMVHEKEELGYWDGVSPYKKGKPGLWVWDIEASMEKVYVPFFTLYDYDADDESKLLPITNVSYYVNRTPKERAEYLKSSKSSNTVLKHNVNLIVLKNVMSKETFVFNGYDANDNPFKSMIDMLLNTNQGDHILLAHNAAGYDTIMLYNYLVQDRGELKLTSINNGSKFLELTVSAPKKTNFIKFRDTMKHLVGSLKGLAKAFNEQSDNPKPLAKGFFPYLFMKFDPVTNKPVLDTENHQGELKSCHDYQGEIPDICFFNLTFSVKSEQDYQEFLEYHASWKGKVWNYKVENEKYCRMDVDCLDMIVETVEKNTMAQFGISQWKFVTMPACISYAFKIWLTRMYELPAVDDDSYLSKVEECAQKYWCVDKPQEVAFARLALRGGSTETRRLYYKRQPDEEIRYIDQNSQYPAQQIIPGRMFSRGPPTIHVFDRKWTPCFKHRYSAEMCFDCPKDDRYSASNKSLNLVFEDEQWSEEKLLSLGPCGIIQCTVFVPNMFHPPLMTFDDERALSPCGEFDICCNIFNLQDAIKVGVKVLKIARIDIRAAGPSLWRDFMIPLYMQKECASKNMPPESEWSKMIDDWEERAEMGEDIRRALEKGEYKKNTVIKTLSKFRINNIWGKNAEQPVKSSLATYDTRIQEDRDKWYQMFQDCSDYQLEIQSCIPICDDRHLYKVIKSGQAPNLSKGYLAAAVEVPAYGRRDQWIQRFKMGKNVLYYDTDSLVLIWKQGDYCPPIDNLIGGWEYEKDYAEGIDEVVFPAPKNYALKLSNGKTFVKAKGVQTGRGTENIVNFESMKANTLKALQTKRDSTFLVPQQQFVHRLGGDTRTMVTAKKITATVDKQKGPVDINGLVFPKNYTGDDLIPLLK